MIDKPHPRQYVRTMARSRQFGGRWLVLMACLFLPLLASGAWAGAVEDANAGKAGQSLDLSRLAARGKTTLIDFYSPFCPPCVRLAPVMEQLAARRPDLAIKKVDINRPEAKGIDWRSPLAQQYKIRRLPYFMIFSPQGKLVAQGRAAEEQLKRWFQEAGMMQ